MTGNIEERKSNYVLEMKQIVKTFPGVKALNGVSISLKRGEVLGLLGENGAGKSTLIKILAGDYEMDSGSILIDGKTCNFKTPSDSQKEGIRVIYQELISLETMTVTENIFVNDLPVKGPFKRIDWDLAHKEAEKCLKSMGVEINPKTYVSDLSVHEKQIVEIAKAIHKETYILVMDEPTAALGMKDTESLFSIIKSLRKKGVAIIYISHRMEEIFSITDRVTVLRDGNLIGTEETKNTHSDALISMMIGKELKKFTPKKKYLADKVCLSVRNLSTESSLKNISFDVHESEVLGLFGLLGSGRFNIIHALFGLEKITRGKVYKNGKKIKIGTPALSLNSAMGYMPLDRKQEGLALDLTVRENITLCNIDNLGNHIMIDSILENQKVEHWIKELNIKTSSKETIVGTLSGGNQQKIVLAKMLERDSKILLMIEPTRGVDVGAKAEIYQKIEDLCSEGYSIVVASSDIPEMISICDRIEVLKKGEIIKTLTKGEMNKSSLLTAAAGGEV
ncbi:MAG: sugar ABC transporter ATP-binding protein [Spirochaetia bacterium]|nr:sugar ABC transporter ATP-binding protein [Spirochaetia bacterium]MCF7945854.1 sugar ABC transporter ATP-binding protein [Spirochaetia bacterium]